MTKEKSLRQGSLPPVHEFDVRKRESQVLHHLHAVHPHGGPVAELLALQRIAALLLLGRLGLPGAAPLPRWRVVAQPDRGSWSNEAGLPGLSNGDRRRRQCVCMGGKIPQY